MTNRHAVFLDRPSRFVARVRLLDGTIQLVHVASSGRMTELLVPGAATLITGKGGPGRVTAGRLAMVQTGDTWVSVDTSVPGKVLGDALRRGTLDQFAGYDTVRPEYKFGASRLDFLLSGPEVPQCLLEVKSVTSVVREADGTLVARFPDAPTERGTRHLHELASAVQQGYRAAVCLIVQRGDAQAVGPFDAIDPDFGAALRSVHQKRVEVYGLQLIVDPAGIHLGGALPLRI